MRCVIQSYSRKVEGRWFLSERTPRTIHAASRTNNSSVMNTQSERFTTRMSGHDYVRLVSDDFNFCSHVE
jgi:hypothetical protein